MGRGGMRKEERKREKGCSVVVEVLNRARIAIFRASGAQTTTRPCCVPSSGKTART